MTIRHDSTDISTVTTCSECPYWSSFSSSRDEAEERAARHRMNVHGLPEARARRAGRDAEAKARDAAAARERRAAARRAASA
jgi:hypothetical protein